MEIKTSGCAYLKTTSAPPLDTAAADKTGTFNLSSADDAAFVQGLAPSAIARKSKQVNWLEPDRMRGPIRHHLYLTLPKPLKPGASYQLDCSTLNLAETSVSFTFTPATLRSEAIHVNQVGFRADDPGKRAYLSLWKGNGGGHSYANGLPFQIVSSAGDSVFTGTTGPVWPKDRQEFSAYGTNAAKSDVHPIDFAELTTPGTFRVVIYGIGCSYPFVIGDEAWHQAFVTSLRGFFLNRSGIAKKPPHSDIILERDMHPEDGVTIYQSTFDITTNAGGQNEVFKDLVAGKTEQTVSNARGGYHDAGDWDRRMQTAKGGIPHGIESADHPRDGEVSWHESLSIFVYAPDVWSTFRYCASAAQAAMVLRSYDRSLAKAYQESALKAWDFAETRYDDWKAMDSTQKYHSQARDLRNLSALMLYRLTEDDRWHQMFLQDSALPTMSQTSEYQKHNQRDAPFFYALLPDSLGDPALKAKAKQAIINTANAAIEYGTNNAFNLHFPNKYMPRINGFWSAPLFPDLARAHYLSKDERYLRALNLAVGFGLGANPMDMALTTGIGHNPAVNPLHIDTRRTGQAAPEGLTLYGICDLDWALKVNHQGMTWPFKWFLSKTCEPSGYDWPVAEAYFDVWLAPMMTEFTIMGPMEYACYNWGYLALRD